MSTQEIRRLIDAVADSHGEGRVRLALTEVEAIEAAAREFAEHSDDARCSAWQLMERIAKDSASAK